VSEASATLQEVAEELWSCATAWDPETRLLGNVRAADIARLCSEWTGLPARRSWTRTPPSEPGWYWAVTAGGEVRIADVRDGLAWGFALDGSRYGGSWWLGPLPVPPLPQEEEEGESE